LGEGKYGNSSLIEKDGRLCVLKEMHDKYQALITNIGKLKKHLSIK
jgi:hypothetical protein